jgi:hypothetical protein
MSSEARLDKLLNDEITSLESFVDLTPDQVIHLTPRDVEKMLGDFKPNIYEITRLISKVEGNTERYRRVRYLIGLVDELQQICAQIRGRDKS